MNAAAPAIERSAIRTLLDQFAEDLSDVREDWAALVVLSHWLSLAQDVIARLRQLGPAGDAAIPQVDTLLRRALNVKYCGTWQAS